MVLMAALNVMSPVPTNIKLLFVGLLLLKCPALYIYVNKFLSYKPFLLDPLLRTRSRDCIYNF